MSTGLANRADILAAFGANAAVRDELLAYDPDSLGCAAIRPDIHLPLEDEPFVPVWREYRDDASRRGLSALADRLVQLSFPIRAGISRTDEYRAATLRGEPPAFIAAATGLVLARPDSCRLAIHPTWAGSIPAIETGCREDFESLLRAFTARNEPVPIPSSQGACIVSGYTNWDRVRRFRERWTSDNPGEEFSLAVIADRHEAYQDRFLLLSSGSYSGVAAETVGVPPADWPRVSMTIRREHECAHYWTRRVLSTMRNRVLDELIADCCGALAACGAVRADWLLAFLGVDRAGDCRDGGRLRNYRGNPPLSDEAFGLLLRVVVAAVENVECFAFRHAAELSGRRGLLVMLLTLTTLSLEELASAGAQARLDTQLECGRAIARAARG